MRVAFLTNFVPPQMKLFFKELSARVDDLTIFVSTEMESNRPWQVEWKDLKVVLQKTFTMKRIKHHPSGFTYQIFVHIPYDTLFQLIKYKPQVIITSEMGFRTFMALLYKFINPRVTLIISAQISSFSELGRGIIRENIRKIIIPKADAIIVIGNSGREYFRRFGVADNKIHIISLVIDNRSFTNPNTPQSKHENLRMLIVGQLIPGKGLIKFLDQISKYFSLYSEQKYELWFVGDGIQRKELEDLTKKKNINAQFFGNVEYQKMPEVYHQADVMVFPTLSDVWGYVVNEAMASRVPVFGSKYSQAVEELIVDTENGWFYDPLDEENALLKLDELFNTTPERLSQMGENAFHTIEKLDMLYMVEEFLAVINEKNDPD